MKTFGMRFGSPDAASSGPLDDSLVHFEQASSFSNELGMVCYVLGCFRRLLATHGC